MFGPLVLRPLDGLDVHSFLHHLPQGAARGRGTVVSVGNQGWTTVDPRLSGHLGICHDQRGPDNRESTVLPIRTPSKGV